MSLLAEPVVGFRAWTAMRDWKNVPWLHSLWHHDAELHAWLDLDREYRPVLPVPFRWELGTTKAEHYGEVVEVLGDTQRYGGLYAYHEADQLYGYPEGVLRERRAVHGAGVFGGRMAVATRGLRAEYGRPVALLLKPWTQSDLVEDVAARYGIPIVHSRNDLAREASRWGRPYDTRFLCRS